MHAVLYTLVALVIVGVPTLYAGARYDRWCATEFARIDKQALAAMHGA